MNIRLRALLPLIVVVVFGLGLAGCGDELGVDQHGRKVPAERLDSQWLVINYWAEWCGPCRTEIPELNALATQVDPATVGVFGVNFDGLQGAELKRAVEALGIEFTVLAQDPASRYGLPRSQVLPATYIVDARGQLRERLLGEQTAAGLQARLKALQAGR